MIPPPVKLIAVQGSRRLRDEQVADLL